MSDMFGTTRFHFWLCLIRLIGVIVPRRLRADWKQDWESELRHRELLQGEWDRIDWRSKLDLFKRSTSCRTVVTNTDRLLPAAHRASKVDPITPLRQPTRILQHQD